MGFKGREPREGAASATEGVGALTAFIDQGSEFSGKLSFKDTVRIDGHFQGEITSDNTLIVGETGQVFANIDSEVVIVSGEVKGDISARRHIALHKTARVEGNIHTQALVVEEGAQFNGQIGMGAKKSQAKEPEASGEKVVNIREEASSSQSGRR